MEPDVPMTSHYKWMYIVSFPALELVYIVIFPLSVTLKKALVKGKMNIVAYEYNSKVQMNKVENKRSLYKIRKIVPLCYFSSPSS